MQQLSLFDFGEETPKPEKKKKAVPKAASLTKETATPTEEAAIPEVAKEAPAVDSPLSADFFVEDLEATPVVAKEESSSDEVVFADEQIVVKVKPKAIPQIETAPVAAPEEPLSKIEMSREALPDSLSSDAELAPEAHFVSEEKLLTIRKRGRKSFKEIDAAVDLVSVPPDEELFKKQYYPISVVAKWFGVNNSLLRFWENEFKILKPKKNKKGDRFFRPEDVKNLQVIYYLLRQKKLTINGAVKHLKANKENTEVNLQLIESLQGFKSFLLELKAGTEK